MIKFIYEDDEQTEAVESAQMIIGDESSVQEICNALLKFLPSAGYMIDQVNDSITYENADKVEEDEDEKKLLCYHSGASSSPYNTAASTYIYTNETTDLPPSRYASQLNLCGCPVCKLSRSEDME